MSAMIASPTNTMHHNKRRANSDGYNLIQQQQQQQQLEYNYALKRASSSEAQLPSYCDTDTNTNKSISSSSSHEADISSGGYRYTRSASLSSTSHEEKGASPPRSRKLQTIESGICLSDKAAEQSSPKPPLFPNTVANNNNNSLPPHIPHVDSSKSTSDDDGSSSSVMNLKPNMVIRNSSVQSHTSQHSTISHYSLDAGKHGFLSQQYAPSSYHTPGNNNNTNDNDSIAETDVASISNGSFMSNTGSLVFKYQVGEETPPAEYALPASILRVYGDDLVSNNAFISPDSGGGTENSSVEQQQGGRIDSRIWQRANSNGSNGQGGSYSSIVYSPSSDEEDEELIGGSFNEHKSNNSSSSGHTKNQPRKSPQKSPPRAPQQSNRSSSGARGGSSQCSSNNSNSSSLGIPHLLAQTNNNVRSSPDREANRILPYHERKRLLELEQQKEEEQRRIRRKEEEKRRKDKNMSMKPGSRTSTNRMNHGKSSSSGRGGGRGSIGRGGRTSYNKGERTPLNGTKDGYGSNNDIDFSKGNNEQKKEGGGWFGQIVSIVTGKSNTTSGNTNNDDDIESQKQQQHNIEEETKSYRDQANAFLKKTEKERLLLKEQKKSDEIHNVTVPVSTLATGGYTQTSSYGGGIGHGGNHSRSKMSSMSAALDSIASCSDEEEEAEEEDTEDYSSDDEESYYFETNEPTTRVWKYGDLPTTTTTTSTKTSSSNNNASSKKKKNKKKLSKHDVIMKRERILQEEYEYRLHSLKKENEKLSKRFRIFVLVTVALIFMGALAFALVICFRMLMSI